MDGKPISVKIVTKTTFLDLTREARLTILVQVATDNDLLAGVALKLTGAKMK